MARSFYRFVFFPLCMALSVCLALYLALGLMTPPPLNEGIEYGRAIEDCSGRIIRLGLSPDQKYRLRATLDEVAPESVRCLLAYEDRHFYSHPGVDLPALLRAAASTLLGRRMGASTITMQVARLRYGMDTSTPGGKARQIFRALLLERHYSKKDILEAYFNLAPYGGNIEGIEAAARIYFDKPASRLSESECRALTVVPQNPRARHPVRGAEFASARALLDRLLGDENNNGPAPLKVRGQGSLPFMAPHLSTELLASDHPDPVRTFIRPDRQKILERVINDHVERNRRHGIRNAAAILVNTESMQVEALAGSASFFARDIEGQVDGTRARRSPGSTLKPFIYALALEQGLIHPRTILSDSPKSFGGYDPENFDRGFRGPLPAEEALRASRNLPAVALAEQLAAPGLYGFLLDAGVRLQKEESFYGLALALGGAEVSMRELASLYAMLANHGLWQPLRLLRGEVLPAPRQLLSPEAAYITLSMLEQHDNGASGMPLRCKTGTSNGFRDAWTAGIAGPYALVVWVGNFDNSSNPNFVGAEAALPLFRDIFSAIGACPDRFRDSEAGLNLVRLEVCASTGDLDVSRCGEREETLFIPGVSPAKDSGILRPLLIDRATGLRACEMVPGQTEEVYWEFWPSEQRRIFAQAGISKPLPPDWLPQCRNERGRASRPPTISLPKKNVVYFRSATGAGLKIPLRASADPEAGFIYWYADKKYLGKTEPEEIFFWQPDKPGKVTILAVDDNGGSQRQTCTISLVP